MKESPDDFEFGQKPFCVTHGRSLTWTTCCSQSAERSFLRLLSSLLARVRKEKKEGKIFQGY